MSANSEPTHPITLVEPSRERLPGYAAALEAGWSPDTVRDVSAEQLSQLRADPTAFLRSLTGEGQATITDRDGYTVPRLPGAVRWIWDGDFCGGISLRYAPGTEELPPHISGHIGFSVVPWKQRRGYATEALRTLLQIAQEAGLRRVLLTCDEDNLASCRVIEKCGGVLSGTAANRYRPGIGKLQFWIET